MVATLIDRDIVRVTGADAATYLQGQVSQDIDTIVVGGSAWSLLLHPNGKLAAWFRIHRLDESEFLFDADEGAGEAMISRLERFKLRTDVDFRPEQDWRMLAQRGELSDAAITGLTARFEWPGFDGVDVLGPGLSVPDSIEIDAPMFEEARIRAGVPRMGVDLDDETIPAEGGQAMIDGAVSFTKGCYTGQELVARINSRGGHVPRPLRRLEGGGPISVGAVVIHEGAEVGRVSSAAGTVALARVMRKVEPGSAVAVAGVSATLAAAVSG